MTKIFINTAGSWIDLDAVTRFESTTARGLERKDTLLVTGENNAIRALSNTGDGKTYYSVLSYGDARNWFSQNKLSQQEIPECFRDFRPDLQIK